MTAIAVTPSDTLIAFSSFIASTSGANRPVGDYNALGLVVGLRVNTTLVRGCCCSVSRFYLFEEVAGCSSVSLHFSARAKPRSVLSAAYTYMCSWTTGFAKFLLFSGEAPREPLWLDTLVPRSSNLYFISLNYTSLSSYWKMPVGLFWIYSGRSMLLGLSLLRNGSFWYFYYVSLLAVAA